jgi:hypothetical protein
MFILFSRTDYTHLEYSNALGCVLVGDGAFFFFLVLVVFFVANVRPLRIAQLFYWQQQSSKVSLKINQCTLRICYKVNNNDNIIIIDSI